MTSSNQPIGHWDWNLPWLLSPSFIKKKIYGQWVLKYMWLPILASRPFLSWQILLMVAPCFSWGQWREACSMCGFFCLQLLDHCPHLIRTPRVTPAGSPLNALSLALVGIFVLLLEVKVKVAQSCLILWDPMDYTVHGILQARTLQWVAFPFSRCSFQPGDPTQVSCIAGRFFISWAKGKPWNTGMGSLSLLQGIFPTQKSNQGSPALQADSLPTELSGKPMYSYLELALECQLITLNGPVSTKLQP